MADPQLAATVSPVPTGPVQPANPAPVDDGYERVSRDELTALRRNSERARGMEGFFQEANKRGFKRPEDFGKYDKFDGVLKKRGMTMDQVQALLDSDGQESTAEEVRGIDPAALDKYLADKGYVNSKALDEREALIGAKFSHKESIAKEQAAIEKAVAELAGDKATDFQKRSFKAMLREMAEEKRALYPEGHPLRDKELAPHDEKSLAGFMAEIKKLQGLADGADLAAQGDDALKGKPRVATPAGSSNTTSNAPPPKGTGQRPGGLPAKAAVEAAYAKKVAARGGGTVSSLGG